MLLAHSAQARSGKARLLEWDLGMSAERACVVSQECGNLRLRVVRLEDAVQLESVLRWCCVRAASMCAKGGVSAAHFFLSCLFLSLYFVGAHATPFWYRFELNMRGRL